jgi:predicted branched-subunit amino acid permease
VIDESTAMAVAQPTPRAGRYALWSTGLILFVLWSLGGLAGSVVGKAINPSDFGLDAAAPAIFLALLYPQLKRPGAPLVAILGALVALALIPIAPAGAPVIAAAAVAVLAGTVNTNPNRHGNRKSSTNAETE